MITERLELRVKHLVLGHRGPKLYFPYHAETV
jgi:hypothetical protein